MDHIGIVPPRAGLRDADGVDDESQQLSAAHRVRARYPHQPRTGGRVEAADRAERSPWNVSRLRRRTDGALIREEVRTRAASGKKSGP
jgi:hypothetical protein